MGRASSIRRARDAAAAIALALGAALVASGAGAAPLTIGRVDNNSPLSEAAMHVLGEAFARAGLEPPRYRALPAQRSVELAHDGELDADLMRIADVGRRYPNLIALRTPIARVDVAVYGRRPLDGCTRADIAHLRIGIRRGLFVLTKATAGLAVTEAPNDEAVFDMLAGGRFDAAILVHVDTDEAARARPGLRRWPYAWASEPLYFWLHRRHAALAPRLDAALAAMQRDGLIERHLSDAMRARRIEALKPAPAQPAPGAAPCV